MPHPVTVSARGSFRTEVTAGKHRLVLDEPESAGGTDEGPTPYDALAAALGGCTAMTLHFFSKREGIPLEGVDVTLHHDREHARDCAECLTTSGFIHRFRVEIALQGDLTGEQKERLLAIAKKCPVAKTLGAEIQIDEILVEP